MGKRIKKIRKIKNIRLHHEGTDILMLGLASIVLVAIILWYSFDNKIPFYAFILILGAVYGITINFFRCPIRHFEGETEGIVVAPADGKVVVLEEVFEDKYFHEQRQMVSIFMSLFNVHANWFPCDGTVDAVHHFNGNFHKAWLPKASEENERADIIITADNGQKILCRQVAGAVARRIVTYAKPEDNCSIDEHLGFIKFGSRVDLYLPMDAKITVKMGESTTGDVTVIGYLNT
ncbi:MAG: phosphatidylserine decarboxylase family protein [Bacteroidaceae bacterium]|nr:phosphatidylserine decarboxylase family protein [Bacteroidaceae bacterium]